MALKILSGMVKIPQGGTSAGSFEITFIPFVLATASHTGVELRKEKEIGPEPVIYGLPPRLSRRGSSASCSFAPASASTSMTA